MMNNNDKEVYHIPVMLEQCVAGLNINPDGVYVDVTFGGGGHSRVIMSKLSEKGKLIVFDQDPDAKMNAWDDERLIFVPSNFAYLKNNLRLLGVNHVDGILADLGVSSHQFDQPERGFSIRSDEKLDMRMNQTSGVSALDLVNDYGVNELMLVLAKYGEIKSPRKTAELIVKERLKSKIQTTGQLVAVLEQMAPKKKQNQFYAQVFQAIRIEVNKEKDVLEQFLLQTPEVLNEGGRLVVMSYHSLEDRMVKNFFKRGSIDGKIEKDFYGNLLRPFVEVNRKPIVADDYELELNPRSRSAKLRIAVRNEQQ